MIPAPGNFYSTVLVLLIDLYLGEGILISDLLFGSYARTTVER